MKTTIDLPPTLVREMKLRAVDEGRRLKDVAGEIFQKGLEATSRNSRSPRKTEMKFPLFGIANRRCQLKNQRRESSQNGRRGTNKQIMSRSGFLFDSNVWVALSFARHAGFEIAKAEFEKHDSHQPIIVCRSIQQSFLRLITNVSIQQAYQEEPITNREACTRWTELLSLPQVEWLDEPADPESHWSSNVDLDHASSKQ